MKMDLASKERRLRYHAAKKGLYVQKNNKPITGYRIGKMDSGLVIAGYHHIDNLMPLEEAEEFVAGY